MSYQGLLYGHSRISALGAHSGKLLALLRDTTGTKWNPTTRVTTPERCGLDIKPSQTTKGRPAVLG